MKRKSRQILSGATVALGLFFLIEKTNATEIEPLKNALVAILGRTSAVKKTLPLNGKETTFFFSKDSHGKANKVAFIEHGIYEPNCTHTWAIGIDAKNGKVTEVRPIEMSCPHALPTRAKSFLSQFEGKGPADAAKLENSIDTIAKATGSCKLTAQAVKRSILNFQKIKGSI